MATLEQATAYNELRGYEDWSELPDAQAAALLQDAEDYIRTAYRVRSDLTAGEHRVFDNIVCRLAAMFQTKPPQVAATPAIKKESKEGAGFKKEVEYVAVGSDPYPYITAVIGSFLRPETPTGSGVYMGVVTG